MMRIGRFAACLAAALALAGCLEREIVEREIDPQEAPFELAGARFAGGETTWRQFRDPRVGTTIDVAEWRGSDELATVQMIAVNNANRLISLDHLERRIEGDFSDEARGQLRWGDKFWRLQGFPGANAHAFTLTDWEGECIAAQRGMVDAGGGFDNRGGPYFSKIVVAYHCDFGGAPQTAVDAASLLAAIKG